MDEPKFSKSLKKKERHFNLSNVFEMPSTLQLEELIKVGVGGKFKDLGQSDQLSQFIYDTVM